MHALRLLRARWFGFLRKAEIEEEMDEELRFHLACRTEENLAKGMSPGEARRAAQLRFGNFNSIKDACRDVNGGGLLETIWQDTRFAARMLMRDRGFTAVAVLALALGIGANTALFTVMSNVLLRPLPFPNSGEIVSVWSRESGAHESKHLSLSFPDYQDLAAQNSSLEAIGAFHSTKFILEDAQENVAEVPGAIVTAGILPLLGAEPMLGRKFTPDEDQAGNRSVIISYQLWQEHFGGVASAVGSKLTLDAQEYLIVGVMPERFLFPIENPPAQLWVTFGRGMEPLSDGGRSPTMARDSHFIATIARPKKGISIAKAEADLSAIAAETARKNPRTSARIEACFVTPWLKDMTNPVRPAIFMLAGGALCVLGVACVNIANLLLARANTRIKEIAIRSALGAGRGRILRQLLTESLLLAALGGSAGLILAIRGTHYLVSMLPPNFPRLNEITPDLRVLSFTAILILLTSCLSGFAPAWRSAHCDLSKLLNDCSRGSNETPRGRRAARVLVVVQMLLSFVLLTTACYLIRGLWLLEKAEPGFESHNLFAAHLSVPDDGGPTGPRRIGNFYHEMLERVSRLEKVESVSAVYPLPFTFLRTAADFEIIGRGAPKPEWPRARAHAIGLNYFRTMQIPLLRGRDFEESDTRDSHPVVIINETLARTHFGNEDPLGKMIRPGLADISAPQVREIIGVVGDVKAAGLAEAQRAEVYLPHRQCASSEMALVLRSSIAPGQLREGLGEVLKGMDDPAALRSLKPMESYLDLDKAQPRLSSNLLGAFALVAVFLTAIGVYGVTSYSVAQRRHEIGIRLALGAQKPAVFRLMLGESSRLVLGSVIGGCLLTLSAAPLLRHALHASVGGDTFILLFVTLFLAAVGLFACCLPAHRAAAEDPLAALGER